MTAIASPVSSIDKTGMSLGMIRLSGKEAALSRMTGKNCFIVGATAALLLGAVLWMTPASRASEKGVGAHEKLVFQEKLANVPGKSLTAVVVTYAPGGKSPRHHHAGSVFAYVLSGKIRSENSATGPVRVYSAGDSFFEPPGSEHLVSENASTTQKASLLAIFVADDGAQLTSINK